MSVFNHYSVDLFGRQTRLITDSLGGHYLYDTATAIFTELKTELGQVLANQCLDTDEIADEIIDLAFDAAAVFTALDAKIHDGHLQSANNVDSMHTIAIGVEESCNLACTYCYNDSHYDRPRFNQNKSGMSLEVAISAISAALDLLVAGEGLTVQLIGGEPLLRFPLIKEIILKGELLAYEKGCEIRFGMNTNGIALSSEVTDFLIEHRVGVAISLDGTLEQHNRHRIVKSGRGSYEILEPIILDFLKKYKKVSPIQTCRITAADPDFNFITAVEHVIGLGFNNVGIGIALSRMLTDRTHQERVDIISQLITGFRKLKDYSLSRYKKGERFRVSIFNDTMYTLYAYRPKYVPCGAQRRYVGISANGDIVPCHRFLGTKDSTKISGTVLRTDCNPLAPEERAKKLESLSFSTVLDDTRNDSYSCRTCWARHLCGGECYEVKDVLGDSFYTDKQYMCDLKRALYEMGMEMMLELKTNELFDELMQMNAVLKPKG